VLPSPPSVDDDPARAWAVLSDAIQGTLDDPEVSAREFDMHAGHYRVDEAIATFYDVVGQGKSFGSSPAGQQIQTELQNAVASALLGTKAPDAALKDAQTAAMRAYNQAR